MDSSIGGRGVTKKAEKKVRAVSTKDLPFRQKRQKLAIKKLKDEKKGGPITIGITTCYCCY